MYCALRQIEGKATAIPESRQSRDRASIENTADTIVIRLTRFALGESLADARVGSREVIIRGTASVPGGHCAISGPSYELSNHTNFPVPGENRHSGIGHPFWVNKGDSHSKAKKFNAAVAPTNSATGDRVTNVIEQQLRNEGFEVQVLKEVARPPEAPDSVDEEKVASAVDADAIVHLWIDEIGMYSGKISTQYIPRVNLGGKIWVKNRDDSLYSDVVYYGVDAKKGKPWAITSDERCRWGSFDQLMAHIDDVRDCYATGVRLAAAKLADQISAAVPRATSVPITSTSPSSP